MFRKLLLAAATSMFALSAFAVGADDCVQLTQLKDGSTVHVFADGKMGMEDRFGRATSMEPGHVMNAKDGKTIVMKGNEIARLDDVLNKKGIAQGGHSPRGGGAY
jgi:Copper resistance protein K